MKKAISLLLLFALCLSFSAAELLSIEEMTESAGEGIRFTIAGMPFDAYFEASTASQKWTTVLYAAKPQQINVNLAELYTWDDCERIIRDMSTFTCASVERIGQSEQGRGIYNIKVGMGDRLILLTGGMHAKEPAGTMYILKQLISLLTLYENGDAHIASLLEEFSIVAVPCCNPDGRALFDDGDGIDWRANANGVDLNMNFPSANAGQESDESSTMYHATEPAPANYPGPFLGSELETQALIGWLQEYVDGACAFINYAQNGRYVHGVGAYLSESCQDVSEMFAQNIADYLTHEGAAYSFVERQEEMRGWSGGSIADFAAELAEGLTFSEKYGRLGLNEGEGPLPLCFFGDIDECAGVYASRTQTPIACISIDISTKGGIGYHSGARRNHEKEYDQCEYNELLTYVMEYFEWWTVDKSPDL